MFPRYKLTARLGNEFVFDKYFPSINAAIKVASGFDTSSCDMYVSIFDTLTDRIFSNAFVMDLVKEFRDD